MWIHKDGDGRNSVSSSHSRRKSFKRSRSIARAVVKAIEPRTMLSAGLTGEYFNSIDASSGDLTNFVAEQNNDPTSWAFNWGNHPPITGLSPILFPFAGKDRSKRPLPALTLSTSCPTAR